MTANQQTLHHPHPCLKIKKSVLKRKNLYEAAISSHSDISVLICASFVSKNSSTNRSYAKGLLCTLLKWWLCYKAVNLLECWRASLRTLLPKFLDIVLVTDYPVTLCNTLGDQRPQLQHGKSLEPCMFSFQLNKEVVCQKQPPRQTTIHDYCLKIHFRLSFPFIFMFILHINCWIHSNEWYVAV